jgi:hypothetical protein
MNEMIEIQNASNMNSLPANKLITEWVEQALD